MKLIFIDRNSNSTNANRLKTRLTTLLATLCVPLVFTPLRAQEAKKERIQVTVQIPDTTEALWSQIDGDTKALAELVAATKKDEVYAMAETVEALVNAIPEKYPDLAADKKKRVAGQVKNTARVLDDLHDSMDAGKTEEARRNSPRSKPHSKSSAINSALDHNYLY